MDINNITTCISVSNIKSPWQIAVLKHNLDSVKQTELGLEKILDSSKLKDKDVKFDVKI